MNIKLLFLFLFLGFSWNASSQDEESCFRINNFSTKERNQNYPYNKASRIAFVSFKGNHTKLSEDELKGVSKIEEIDETKEVSYFISDIMRKYFSILRDNLSRYNSEDFEENINLTESQKNKLTDYIFNYKVKTEPSIFYSSTCLYVPRNAILFFNDKDELFAIIDICFDCSNYKTSSNNINLGEYCSDKIILIKNLFAEVGIKYGVERD